MRGKIPVPAFLLAGLLVLLSSPASAEDGQKTILLGSWGQGAFRLDPGATRWEQVGKDAGFKYVYFIATAPDGTAYCGVGSRTLYRSSDAGTTWTTAIARLPVVPSGLAIDATNLNQWLLTSWGDGIWWSDDAGATWSEGKSPSAFMRAPLAAYAPRLASFYAVDDGNRILATDKYRGDWRKIAALPQGIKAFDLKLKDASSGEMLIATNAGVARMDAKGGITFLKLSAPSAYAHSLAVSGDRVLVGLWGGGVVEWGPSETKFINAGLSDRNISALAASSRTRAAGEGKAKGRSIPRIWTPKTSGLANLDTNFIICSPNNELVMYCATKGGVHKSTNGGDTWNPQNEGLTTQDISMVVVDPDNPDVIYATGWGAGVHKSTNAGSSWTNKNKGIPNNYIMWLEIDPRNHNTIYAITWGNGIFKTEDAAENWIQFSEGIPGMNGYCVVVGDAEPYPLFCSIDSAGLFEQKDGKWTEANRGNTSMWVMNVAQNPKDSNIWLLATAGSGVFRSDDGGTKWYQSNNGLTNQNVNHIAFHPTKAGVVYAASKAGGGIFRSTDSGFTWKEDNQGITDLSAKDVFITSSGVVYVCTSNGLFVKQD